MTLLEAQMALPLAVAPRRFDTPVVAADSNAAARVWLAGGIAWPQLRLALWGAVGSGKTSLLRDWATRTGARLLAGAGLRAVAEDLAVSCPLAIDDAGAATERALLHLLNAAQEAGHAVLLADALPPARWVVALPDLASRLRAITAVELGAPEDDLLRALLARQLAARQLRVPEATLAWLLARLPRTHAAMIGAVERLDRAAQASGQPIAPALARRVLADIQPGPDDDAFDAPAGAGFHASPEMVTEASSEPPGELL